MHKTIKRFWLSGDIRDDADFIRLRAELERLIEQEMRSHGYVPVLDLGSFFSTMRDDKKYQFEISMYGTYIGKRKAESFEGWDNGRLIQRIIVKTKSEKSSNQSDSKSNPKPGQTS